MRTTSPVTVRATATATATAHQIKSKISKTTRVKLEIIAGSNRGVQTPLSLPAFFLLIFVLIWLWLSVVMRLISLPKPLPNPLTASVGRQDLTRISATAQLNNGLYGLIPSRSYRSPALDIPFCVRSAGVALIVLRLCTPVRGPSESRSRLKDVCHGTRAGLSWRRTNAWVHDFGRGLSVGYVEFGGPPR